MTLTGEFTPDNLIAGDADIVTEDVLIPSGNNLVRGTVLGRVKQSTPNTGTPDGGNTGDGTCTAVTGGGKTIPGVYTIECIAAAANGGTFKVKNPNGDDLGTVEILGGAGGTGVFGSSEINFTLTDGATDFVVGDKFTVTVTDGVPDSAACVGTGDGTLTEVEGRRELKIGAYVIECTAAVANGGVFKVTDPDGNIIQENITIPPGAGNNIVFENDQIKGKITDGATDFAVADTFTITTTIAPRQCKAADKAATDGSSEPYSVLAEDTDASSADKVGASYISGEFNERSLVFATGNDIEDFRDKMRDVGMFTKGSEPA
jgi:hypothetical protein